MKYTVFAVTADGVQECEGAPEFTNVDVVILDFALRQHPKATSILVLGSKGFQRGFFRVAAYNGNESNWDIHDGQMVRQWDGYWYAGQSHGIN